MIKSFFLNIYIMVIFFCCATVLITSCGDNEETVPVTDVSFDNPTLLLIEGQKQILKAIIAPENATNKSVTWSSSSTGVATVSSVGEVEAKTVGTTTITATTVDGSKVAVCEVKVMKSLVSVTSVSLNKTELPLLIGGKETLIATIVPDNATVKTVAWTTSDAAVASVSQTGEVEARAIGSATITATTLDGEKTATCVVTVDASEFTVTFNTNGGTSIENAVIEKGNKLNKPTDPTKEGGLDEGLYPGKVNIEMGTYTFGGWYTDEQLTIAYDFDTEVVEDLTLYAKWDVNSGDLPEPIDLESINGDNIMVKAINYLKSLSLDTPAEYTLLLANNITSNNELSFNNKNVTLHFMGKGTERVIKRTINGNVFTINGGTFVLHKNIKVTAENIGSYYAFNILGGGHLVMEDGAKISDIKGATGRSAAVYVTDGASSFTMNGGEICNNELVGGSGNIIGVAVCLNWGSFYMKGGLISGNKLETSFNTHCVAGGVMAIRRTPFIKTGGVIENNTAEITTAGGAGRTGQQVFCFATAGDGGAVNHRKVDDNLSKDDNLSNKDMANPLWKVVP